MSRRQWYIAPADGCTAVGEALTLPRPKSAGGDHAVVVAELVDSARQVVLDVAI